MSDLTKRDRLRRVVLLCCHFARNLAYYRAWHKRPTNGNYSQILVTIDGNFLDMAVLEWCKLFGDKKGNYYWGRVVSSQNFEEEMLENLGVTTDQFADYIDEMRKYRDKFLAHLDDELVMNIPNMDQAKMPVEFYHDYLVCHETQAGDLAGLPTDLTVYYQQCSDEALSMIKRCNL